MLLYHTHEYTGEWKTSELPLEEKVPRSIVGTMDGFIKPAKDYINVNNPSSYWSPEHFEYYLNHGTIKGCDLIKKFRDLDDGCSHFTKTQKPRIIINGIPYEISFQISIQKRVDGRYTTISGEEFDVFIKLRYFDPIHPCPFC